MRPEKYIRQNYDRVLKIEKGFVRERKLEKIIKTLNTDFCCPKLMTIELAEKEEEETKMAIWKKHKH